MQTARPVRNPARTGVSLARTRARFSAHRNYGRDDILATRTGQRSRLSSIPRPGLLIMSFHSLVVRTPAGVLLVDTCVGNHKDRPMLPEWHQQEWPYLERLARVGLTPGDIDFVCCTHLHGDHVGWNTRLVDGSWVPTFPNARYLFARSELEYWQNHHEEDPGEYLPPAVGGQRAAGNCRGPGRHRCRRRRDPARHSPASRRRGTRRATWSSNSTTAASRR